ncbi:hypothetical protein MFFC18_18680 [Mariniblastus fucicola]|uniref:Uncharacterized protein n=2 Tax=Mariniblastus fucicola TaxID=980251 RepID=A0A5B9P606_9BACT|nr:hypothetical protein MFFC18_18680 [Mariniblastus fucicola]
MTPETKQLVIEMRSQIPAPISLCQRALASANNDITKAITVARQLLVGKFAIEMAISQESTETYLDAADYDTELASRRWRSDNPTPPPSNRDVLVAGGELAIEITNVSPSLSTFVHIIPDGRGTFDFRVIAHHPKYTEQHYGLDYDYAILDTTTRISRFNPIDLDGVLDRLQSLNVELDDLAPTDSIDSCLVNTTIDYYLVPDRHPHLWQV